MHHFWLLKTEPGTYSFVQLLKDKKTNWNGVRNYQARNNLRLIERDDLAFIYHSGDEKAVVGLAKVTRKAYPDPDPESPKGDWVQIDLVPVRPLPQPVPLSTIRGVAALKSLPLIRHTRLSVMPITQAHFEALMKLGNG